MVLRIKGEDVSQTRRYKAKQLLRAGEVGLSVADLVSRGRDRNQDGAVGIGGPARRGIVSQKILGAELAVDAIEDSR